MANVLVVPISSGADGLVVTGAVAAALGAQTFRAFDNKAETLLAQGKSDDWFDSLVGKVEGIEGGKTGYRRHLSECRKSLSVR